MSHATLYASIVFAVCCATFLPLLLLSRPRWRAPFQLLLPTTTLCLADEGFGAACGSSATQWYMGADGSLRNDRAGATSWYARPLGDVDLVSIWRPGPNGAEFMRTSGPQTLWSDKPAGGFRMVMTTTSH